jgi:hypothetical protein
MMGAKFLWYNDSSDSLRVRISTDLRISWYRNMMDLYVV